jgi:hypothetical protein
MGFAPHSVKFLARATWAVGALTLAAWLIDSGVIVYAGPAGAQPGEWIAQLFPPLPLYALPGVILFLCARSIERGSSFAAATVFVIGILSLFKVVLLPSSLAGPYFDVPLYLELPARGFATLLSVACAYAWWDIADMKRIRNSSRRGDGYPSPQRSTSPTPAPPSKKNPPRSRPKRDDPPPSQTPWF